MREIKFRAWVGVMEYNVMVGKFGAFYVNPGAKGNGLDDKDTACLSPFSTIYSPQTPVMQWTGLHDKNGKEMYEGDIVKSPDHDNAMEVKYSEVQASDDMTAPGIGFQFNTYPEEMEVIGNIYENPELLDAKK